METTSSPPMPGAVSSEERQAIFRQPYTPAQNRAILATDKSMLPGLLKQRRFLLEQATSPMPCPSCGRRISKAEAVGGLEHYHVDGPEQEYRCTGCHRPLQFGLPFVGAPFWSIDFDREALEKRQGAALDADSSQPGQAPRYVRTPKPDTDD